MPEGALVSFHAHGRGGRDGGLAQVCLPEHNVHNRWRFHRIGLPVLDGAWSETLESLRPEGFYALGSELAFPGGRWPEGALLQLGYTRAADPILFLAQQRLRAVENDLFFGEEGVRVPRSELQRLTPLVVFVEIDEDDEPFPGHRLPLPSMRASDVLGADGLLSKALPGYEARPAQLAMADAVERALAGDRRLLCEAGTGTGKTLAYLVPAILSGKKVVISTATKALQEQIVTHDLPLLVKHAGLRPNVALLKGISNYVCRRRYETFRVGPEALLPENAAALRTVSSWIHETDSGDLAELVTLREAHPVRLEIASGSETRIGQSCSYFENCFVTARKRDAERAQIVVVNHHLLFADLALRGPHQGAALPHYDAVILDEAHQIEDVATDFFGTRVSSLRVETLLRDAERGFEAQTNLSTTGPRLVQTARVAALAFFAEVASLVPDEMGRQSLPEGELPREIDPAYLALDGALGVIGTLAADEGRGESLDVVARRVQQVRDDLATLFERATRTVLWADVSARNVSLGASPIEVGGLLKKKLFDTVGAAVLTSATLRTGEDFSFVRERVGLMHSEAPVDELAVSSPFDYPSRALLYTPRDLPEVADPRFFQQAGDRVVQLILASGGGAFLLCTSVRAMRLLHKHLAAHRIAPLLLQGDAPKSSLLSRFRSLGNAVLVATMSFWEGVDVPGDALRLVILDKVPFPVPTDPVVAARSRALEEAGGNPFMRYHVPAAAIALKQGFGRLLRTATDRGVVALLDRRVLTKPYGKKLLSSLPPARRSEQLADVEAFFAAGVAGAPRVQQRGENHAQASLPLPGAPPRV